MVAKDWINVCAQLAEVVCYFHEDARCIHSDIKADNILLTNTSALASSSNFNVLLIDNKATERNLGKLYKLSDNEKLLYRTHYLHLVPEIIDGIAKQSTTSDMYSVFTDYTNYYNR